MTDELAELRALAERVAATWPGRWFWHGYANRRGPIDLCHMRPGWGVTVVMGSARLGMQGAQPTFPTEDTNMLVDAADLAVRQVEYRDDLARIDHPVAEWVAASNPSVVLALLDEIDRLRQELNAGIAKGVR